MRRILTLLLLAAPFGCAGPVGPHEVDARFAPPRDAQEAEARLHFLEQRLDAGRLHAQAWFWSWLAINGGGFVVSTIDSVDKNQGDTRAFNIVQASQATLGLADMLVLRPMPGREGAAPVRDAAAQGADVDAQVAEGERLLVASADRAAQRRDWRVHVGNLALQLVSAGALMALDEPGYAGLTLLIGIPVGEVNIWSEPSRAVADLAAYRKLVETGVAPGEPTVQWYLGPTANGVALQVRY
jgi:hypothetical protein